MGPVQTPGFIFTQLDFKYLRLDQDLAWLLVYFGKQVLHSVQRLKVVFNNDQTAIFQDSYFAVI